MEDALMTKGEVAKYLNVNLATVRKLVKSGHLKEFGIGGTLRRYRRKDVDEMIDNLSKRRTD